jgi:hypothetical protein
MMRMHRDSVFHVNTPVKRSETRMLGSVPDGQGFE